MQQSDASSSITWSKDGERKRDDEGMKMMKIPMKKVGEGRLAEVTATERTSRTDYAAMNRPIIKPQT